MAVYERTDDSTFLQTVKGEEKVLLCEKKKKKKVRRCVACYYIRKRSREVRRAFFGRDVRECLLPRSRKFCAARRACGNQALESKKSVMLIINLDRGTFSDVAYITMKNMLLRRSARNISLNLCSTLLLNVAVNKWTLLRSAFQKNYTFIAFRSLVRTEDS